MGYQSKQIFVNLPVKDLNRSIDFFSQLGFEFNPQFTDENAACMIVGENIYAMLLIEPFFKDFIQTEIADATQSTEVLIGLSAASREEVDELVRKAQAAGGKANDPVDHGFMYSCSFRDLDGHIWELIYMDESAIHK